MGWYGSRVVICMGGILTDKSIQPSRPLQLTSVNVRKVNVCMYICCIVLCVVLSVMCINVSYKSLSLGF
jgi:hypothetical protein